MIEKFKRLFRPKRPAVMSRRDAVRLVSDYIKPTRNTPFLNHLEAAEGAVEILLAAGLIDREKLDRRGA